jgi:hypothetical protein
MSSSDGEPQTQVILLTEENRPSKGMLAQLYEHSVGNGYLIFKIVKGAKTIGVAVLECDLLISKHSDISKPYGYGKSGGFAVHQAYEECMFYKVNTKKVDKKLGTEKTQYDILSSTDKTPCLFMYSLAGGVLGDKGLERKSAETYLGVDTESSKKFMSVGEYHDLVMTSQTQRCFILRRFVSAYLSAGSRRTSAEELMPTPEIINNPIDKFLTDSIMKMMDTITRMSSDLEAIKNTTSPSTPKIVIKDESVGQAIANHVKVISDDPVGGVREVASPKVAEGAKAKVSAETEVSYSEEGDDDASPLKGPESDTKSPVTQKGKKAEDDPRDLVKITTNIVKGVLTEDESEEDIDVSYGALMRKPLKYLLELCADFGLKERYDDKNELVSYMVNNL